MRKAILFFPFYFLALANLPAADIEDLQKINERAQVKFVPPEVLDQLLIELRPFEQTPIPGQDTLLLETYRIISATYMANNHYKQAYQVFYKYLNYKEHVLFNDKSSVIDKKMNEVYSQQQKDDFEQNRIRKQLDNLKEKDIQLEGDRRSFKRNFSFVLIVLSSIFALMLVNTGIRMISIRSGLRQSNDKMKKIHRSALIGKLESGLKASMRNQIDSITSQNKDLRLSLEKIEKSFSPAQKANQILGGIEKIIKETLNKF